MACTAVNKPDASCTPAICTTSNSTPYAGCLVGSTGNIDGANVTDDADNNMLSKTMCRVMTVVTGKAGKAFAAFAIISVGIGFFTGKLSWSLMISVAAGIAAMFGAPSIVSAITGKSTFDCGNN